MPCAFINSYVTNGNAGHPELRFDGLGEFDLSHSGSLLPSRYLRPLQGPHSKFTILRKERVLILKKDKSLFSLFCDCVASVSPVLLGIGIIVYRSCYLCCSLVVSRACVLLGLIFSPFYAIGHCSYQHFLNDSL